MNGSNFPIQAELLGDEVEFGSGISNWHAVDMDWLKALFHTNSVFVRRFDNLKVGIISMDKSPNCQTISLNY